MGQREDSGFASFEAGENLEDNRLVALSAARTVVYADAGMDAIGTTMSTALLGEQVAVKLLGTGPGTLPCIASEAIAVNDLVNTAADGKIQVADAGTMPIGRALNAATADGDPVEVLPRAVPLMFISAETTGTGAAQNVAHGLPGTPLGVIVALSELDGNACDVAYGTHTSTNVVLTVTSGAKFKVLAWL